MSSLLACKPLAGIGKISYSLYLWHWPILAFHRYLSISQPSSWMTLACVAATFPIAYLTFAYVEQPARNSYSAITRPMAFTVAALGIFLLAGIGSFLALSSGLPQRFDPAVVRLSSNRISNRNPDAFAASRGRLANPADPDENRKSPHYVLWGDSHAAAIADELSVVAASHGQALTCFYKGASPPIAGLAISNQGIVDFGKRNESILVAIETIAAITNVILAARWSAYLHGRDEEYHIRVSVIDQDSGSAPPKSAHALIECQLRLTVDRLLKSGKNVCLAYPIPDMNVNIPHVLALLKGRGFDPLTFVIPEGQYDERQGEMIGILDRIPGNRLFRIYPDRILRSRDHYVVGNAGESYYRDDNHLSLAGAHFIGTAFDEIFLRH